MARPPEQMSGSPWSALIQGKAIDDGEAHSTMLAYSSKSSYEKSLGLGPSLGIKVM
jgi:hypothetical protein